MRALLEQTPDSLVVADEDGRVRLVNRGFEDMFGYDRAEVLGQHVEMLVPDALRTRHRAHRLRFRAALAPATDGAGDRARGPASRRVALPGRDQPQPADAGRRHARDRHDPRRHRAQGSRTRGAVGPAAARRHERRGVRVPPRGPDVLPRQRRRRAAVGVPRRGPAHDGAAAPATRLPGAPAPRGARPVGRRRRAAPVRDERAACRRHRRAGRRRVRAAATRPCVRRHVRRHRPRRERAPRRPSRRWPPHVSGWRCRRTASGSRATCTTR